jgi:hypothetical protein
MSGQASRSKGNKPLFRHSYKRPKLSSPEHTLMLKAGKSKKEQ